MDIGVYAIDSITDKELNKKIENKKSFVLNNIGRTNFGDAINTIENIIESKGLKCRVYTKGRSATMAAIPISPTVIGGWFAGIFIAGHNLATWDPDYEIGKNLATGTLTVTYKK